MLRGTGAFRCLTRKTRCTTGTHNPRYRGTSSTMSRDSPRPDFSDSLAGCGFSIGRRVRSTLGRAALSSESPRSQPDLGLAAEHAAQAIGGDASNGAGAMSMPEEADRSVHEQNSCSDAVAARCAAASSMNSLTVFLAGL